jgi:hypothetical protein
MSSAPEGVFERGNHVVDYWLAHCEGFKLGKPTSSRQVAAVVCDQRTGRARMLVVKSGAGRPHTLSAAAIAAVDPFNKVLYLEPRAPRRTRQRAGAAAIAIARRLRALAAAGAASGWRYGKDGAIWLRPRVRAAARTTALFTRKHYSETALWLGARVAAVLRAAVAGADALVGAARRRWSSRR